MKNHNFAFIDIEATGLNLQIHEVIEIGCVITTPDLDIIHEFDLKINPEHIEYADPVSLKVSRYDPKEWEDAYSLKEALEILLEKVKDCIMVGHNVAFDFAFLEYNFNKTGLSNTMHYHKLDTISVAWAKLHRDPMLEHFSLRELCARFGIIHEHAHRALPDAQATLALYKKLMEL